MVDPSLKQMVLDAVDQLPPTATIEDLMERLYSLTLAHLVIPEPPKVAQLP